MTLVEKSRVELPARGRSEPEDVPARLTDSRGGGPQLTPLILYAGSHSPSPPSISTPSTPSLAHMQLQPVH